MILGGGNRTDDLPLKSPSTIYPSNCLYDLSPPPKIAREDLPLKSSNFEQNFRRIQHHALLHKGLFCERPISYTHLLSVPCNLCALATHTPYVLCAPLYQLCIAFISYMHPLHDSDWLKLITTTNHIIEI